MKLRDKQIFITGATGFIGSRLTERLIKEEGAKVRALVRQPTKAHRLAKMGVEIIQGDITDPKSVHFAMGDSQIVFHTAAWVGERGDPHEVWAVNVEGTHKLIQAALAAKVERFVHLSSCAVYGSLQKDNIDEETPTRLRGNIYSDSKVEAENMVFQAYQEYGLPIVSARISQVYGPNSTQFTIRPVEVIKSGKMILVDGGRHLCKPIYIDNVIDGLILCAKIDEAVGQAINLTDGITVTWREFFGTYATMMGIKTLPSVPFIIAWFVALFYEIRAFIMGKKARINRDLVKALRSSNSFSNQKAKDLLGWHPKIDFTEGMRRTELWLRTEGYLIQEN